MVFCCTDTTDHERDVMNVSSMDKDDDRACLRFASGDIPIRSGQGYRYQGEVGARDEGGIVFEVRVCFLHAQAIGVESKFQQLCSVIVVGGGCILKLYLELGVVTGIVVGCSHGTVVGFYRIKYMLAEM